jgi:hypothetical protein
MISYGAARWKWKKWEMDKETQRKSRQRIQKKVNAPCNNQLKRTKNGRQKEGKLQPRKLSPENCLQKNQEATESPVPPREQEATESPLLKPINPPPPLKPIYSK